MRELGLYIHIPFCKERCHYCDFLSFSHVDHKIDEYVNALIEEISLTGKIYRDRLVTSIYFGGGTPSYLKEGYLTKIMNSIERAYNLDKKNRMEISIEINPNTLNSKKTEEYKRIGINRISLAVQTFSDEKLQILGRDHTKEVIFRDYRDLKEKGFNNISIDLIMALPGQGLDDVKADLDLIRELNPNHVSYYSLILEDMTRFKIWYDEGKLDLPDEGLERDMYHFAVKYLKEIGYERYEISNFAKRGFESRHNLLYWNRGDYLGLGLGSHSFVDGYRFENKRSFSEYVLDLEKGELPYINKKYIDENEAFEEVLLLNLRLREGLDIEAIEKNFKIDFLNSKAKQIKKLKKEGLIHIIDKKLKLTDLGFDLQNYVVESLL